MTKYNKRRKSRRFWTKMATTAISQDKTVSLDFWGTICILSESPEKIREKVSHRLVEEFELEGTGKNLHLFYNRVAKGLRNISFEIFREGEYRSEDCWYIIGCLIFKSDTKAKVFRNRAMALELEIFCSCSKVPKLISNWLKDISYSNKVFILSDFEHNSKFIRDVLMSNNIVWQSDIFTSSQSNFSKHSGLFFEQEFYMANLHIGDNFHSDFKKPSELGIECILVSQNLSLEILYFFKKLFNKIIKITYKFLILFSYPISMKNYENFLMNLYLHWSKQVLYFLRNIKTVFFVGSEGAFISQQFDSYPIGGEFNCNMVCVNFGRGKLLKATLIANPLYVFSKLVLENWSLSNIAEYFGIEKFNSKVLQETKSISQVFNYFSKNMILTDLIKSNYRDLITQFNDMDERILVVDVGYQASFADILQAIGYQNVFVSQLFGKYSTISTFKKGRVRFGLKVREYVDDFMAPHLDTDFVECFFSLGPRGVKVISDYKQIQLNVIKKSKNKFKTLEISNLKLQKYLLLPPKKFVQCHAKSEFKIDDLNNNSDFLADLPWSMDTNVKDYFWHWALLLKYSRRFLKS